MRKIIIIHIIIAIILVLLLPLSFIYYDHVGFNEFICGFEYLKNEYSCNFFEAIFFSEMVWVTKIELFFVALSLCTFLYVNKREK